MEEPRVQGAARAVHGPSAAEPVLELFYPPHRAIAIGPNQQLSLLPNGRPAYHISYKSIGAIGVIRGLIRVSFGSFGRQVRSLDSLRASSCIDRQA
jgi:hypothetical protein